MNYALSESSTLQPLPAPLPLVVACRSEETAALWRRRARQVDGLEVTTELGCRSYYQLIRRAIAEGDGRPVLLCHDDVRFGLGFADAVRELLDELERTHTRWGVCGNAGISWDGRRVYRYIKDPHGGPQCGLVPEHVLGIDGNVMLLNVPALAAAGVEIPDLGGFHGYDIVLSLECLRRELPVLCDRRLFVMHQSGGDNEAFQRFAYSKIFQDYLAERFVNHSLPTINGLVDFSSAQSYRYLDIPAAGGAQQDFVALFDRALSEGRLQRPSLTIGCRTQFNRSELLTRAVASFAVAAQQAPELVDIRVRIISDQPKELMDRELERLHRLFPGLDLAGWAVPSSAGRFSRTAALLTAVEKAETDFIWFVDDDDYVLPGAIHPLARELAPGVPRLVVGHSHRVQESWTSSETGERQFEEGRLVGRNVADGVYHAFSGDNHTPICSIVFPVAVLRQRLEGVAARGDYYEDYFLLLLALSAARIEVRLVQEDFCGISLRSGENTVNATDREHWDLSYATFMSELLRHSEATSPLLWQLAERTLPGAGAAPLPPVRAEESQRRRQRLKRLCEMRSCLLLVRRFIQLWRTGGAGAALRKAWSFLSA